MPSLSLLHTVDRRLQRCYLVMCVQRANSSRAFHTTFSREQTEVGEGFSDMPVVEAGGGFE